MPLMSSGVSFLPWYLSRSGFGSKVSIWLMPPWVTSRMMDFAFAGNIGGRGASARDGSSSAQALPAPSTAPPIEACRISRRFMASVQIKEFVRVQEHVAEVRQRLRGEEFPGGGALLVARRAD